MLPSWDRIRERRKWKNVAQLAACRAMFISASICTAVKKNAVGCSLLLLNQQNPTVVDLYAFVRS